MLETTSGWHFKAHSVFFPICQIYIHNLTFIHIHQFISIILIYIFSVIELIQQNRKYYYLSS